MDAFEERRTRLPVWLCCRASGLLCSPSEWGHGLVSQAGPFPCAQSSQLPSATTPRYTAVGLCRDASLHRTTPGAAPGRLSCPGVGGTTRSPSRTFFSHLLWPAQGITGCWVMPAPSGSANTRLCRWAGPGLAGFKPPPGFLFPCKNFTPCHILRSRPLLSHGEAAVCFPAEYEARGTLSGSLVPGG